MALGQRAVDPDELEADELEASLLEPGEHAAHQLALDAVGLDEEERSLEFGHGVAQASRSWATPSGVAVGRCRAWREHRVACVPP